LEKGGLILGMMPNLPYQQETITLEPDDWIVMFTDGITEAVNDADEEFEEQRLIGVIQKHRRESSEVMRDKILSAVREFSGEKPQADDITLLSLKVMGD
jgi:sigma-B regulation protein RsbU (phosphoserine phosphatase)